MKGTGTVQIAAVTNCQKGGLIVNPMPVNRKIMMVHKDALPGKDTRKKKTGKRIYPRHNSGKKRGHGKI